MTLFKEWNNLIGNQTKSTIDSFWEEYAGGEKKIYQDILKNYPAKPAGKIGELAAKYEVRPVIFMGFLDGIQTSLANPTDLNALDEESEIELDIQWETLLFSLSAQDSRQFWLPLPSRPFQPCSLPLEGSGFCCKKR